ncbi:MAG TPA: hypothetical protein VMW52_00630, partial [Phycisphaerae bacterium]|nr:hypothetical protein [Phycisphaerae bacterium]
MGTTNQWYLHGLLLPDASWIGQLEDTTPASNVEYITSYAAGAVVPSFRGGRGAVPDITFTTPQIKKILDACGFTGAGYSASYIDLFYRKAKNLNSREPIASEVHQVVRARRCLLYWQTLRASQGQPATLACRILPTFDGTNPPLAGVGSQAIAANLLVSEEFTLGPTKLNGGAWVDGVQEFTLELNPQMNEKASDGQVYPTFAGIRQHDPVITLRGPDVEYWNTIGVAGLQITALASYLRRMQPDQNAAYSDASAQHVKLTGKDNPCGMASLENTT